MIMIRRYTIVNKSYFVSKINIHIVNQSLKK